MPHKLHQAAYSFACEDMRAHHIAASPIANFYASNLHVPNADRFSETRFYNEWGVPQGVAYAAGAIVLQEGPWQTELYVQRSPAQPPFTGEEMEQLSSLVPHLRRAIQMRQRFTEMQLGQNFLIARDSATNRQLSWEIAQAIRSSRGDGSELNGIVLLPRTDRLPLMLMLMIAPMQLARSRAAQGAALMFAFDPEATPSVTMDLVRRLFALSQVEAELSVALCAGKTPDDVAEKRGTSINTVKSQLKSIFIKTGTKRQSELVSLLLSSPAYFLAQIALPESIRLIGL